MDKQNKTNKVLTILCCFFFLFILIVFVFSKIMNKMIEKERKVFDYYMYDLIKSEEIKNKKQFYSIFFYYETRIMFNKTKWVYRIMISLTVLFFIIFKDNLSEFLTCFFKALPVLKWPTVKEVNDFLIANNINNLINIPDFFIVSFSPIIVYKNIDFTNIVLYCSTTYYLILFICILSITKNCIGLLSRFNRAIKICKKLYHKKEKKVQEVQTFSNIINSPIPNVEKYLSK